MHGVHTFQQVLGCLRRHSMRRMCLLESEGGGDIVVFHSAPEIAVLIWGRGWPVASRWVLVRDKIAGEPFGVYLSSSKTEGHQMLRYVLPGTGSAGFV